MLEPELDLELKRLGDLKSSVEVFFTGHFLGPAIATIAAVHFAQLGFNTQAIGFATPRVFCAESSISVNHASPAIITRVESYTDWVGDVPTRHGRVPYTHVGRGLYLDATGHVTTEDRLLRHNFLLLLKRISSRQFAWNVHDMDEYIRRLRLWVG